MPRYSLETQAGAIKSIQQETLGATASSKSSDTKTIDSVNTDYAYLVSSGGSEQAPGVNIQDSTTLFLRWRHVQNHFYRTTTTVLEFYGGRGYE
tara:strand:- start:11 stop:292 length:282 start_codon:yes stop_codon:yes gene_type:complete